MRLPVPFVKRLGAAAGALYVGLTVILAAQGSLTNGQAVIWAIPLTCVILIFYVLWYRATVTGTGVPRHEVWRLPDEQVVVLPVSPQEALDSVRRVAGSAIHARVDVSETDDRLLLTVPRSFWRGRTTLVAVARETDRSTEVRLTTGQARLIDKGYACAFAYMVAEALRDGR